MKLEILKYNRKLILKIVVGVIIMGFSFLGIWFLGFSTAKTSKTIYKDPLPAVIKIKKIVDVQKIKKLENEINFLANLNKKIAMLGAKKDQEINELNKILDGTTKKESLKALEELIKNNNACIEIQKQRLTATIEQN